MGVGALNVGKAVTQFKFRRPNPALLYSQRLVGASYQIGVGDSFGVHLATDWRWLISITPLLDRYTDPSDVIYVQLWRLILSVC